MSPSDTSTTYSLPTANSLATTPDDNPSSNDSNEAPTELPKPKLRLQIHDLRHSGSNVFTSLVPDLASTVDSALAAIIKHLYNPPGPPKHDETCTATISKAPIPTFTPSVPPTRSITVFLRDIGGVAYTTGTELDDDHKEIHVSLQYILTATKLQDPRAEILGVLTHELVHCYQHTTPMQGGDAVLRPPAGLIEGIADFVRLKAGFVPSHWKRPSSAKERAEKWDQGYQHTAFFLEWLEDLRIGRGAVGKLNDQLLRVGYVGEDVKLEDETLELGHTSFWKGLFGSGVKELWDEYGEFIDKHGKLNTERSSGNWEDEIVNPSE
ncbi:basic secretory family protein [Aspergillus alliaceus]|uniref:basic secretory family protein n=1 Tax=Petromyces alliaceus TaxID=209559 RepID=UPI0012A51D21|nr:BSP-domain-containing protein [Aspergillus alliaceus]KAB8232641.1 BSP-domain-containing protein [Aspergillus alliaceus]